MYVYTVTFKDSRKEPKGMMKCSKQFAIKKSASLHLLHEKFIMDVKKVKFKNNTN